MATNRQRGVRQGPARGPGRESGESHPAKYNGLSRNQTTLKIDSSKVQRPRRNGGTKHHNSVYSPDQKS